MYDGRAWPANDLAAGIGETLWVKSLQLSWLLHWPRVRLCCRRLLRRRMVKSPLASWADLSGARCSAVPWPHVLLLRRRFITHRSRFTSMNRFAVWFASGTGMDMAGNSAGCRFAIDRARPRGCGLNELKSAGPRAGLLLSPGNRAGQLTPRPRACAAGPSPDPQARAAAM